MLTKLTFIEHLLYPRHYARCFLCTIPVNPDSDSLM